ncbi:hypothetical protein EK904_012848, partial [Melospiza melodia maxima]
LHTDLEQLVQAGSELQYTSSCSVPPALTGQKTSAALGTTFLLLCALNPSCSPSPGTHRVLWQRQQKEKHFKCKRYQIESNPKKQHQFMMREVSSGKARAASCAEHQVQQKEQEKQRHSSLLHGAHGAEEPVLFERESYHTFKMSSRFAFFLCLIRSRCYILAGN